MGDIDSIEVTGHMIADEIEKISDWMCRNLMIIDKSGNLVRFNTNAEQDFILAQILQQEMRGLPVRIIILKARKIGCSTLIEAYGYYKCHHYPNTRALVAAQDDDACISIFSMTGRFHQYNPDAKPLMSGVGRRELFWAHPNGSRFGVQTAGKTSLARSDTVHFFHGSEIPFWPQQKETMTSVMHAVPDDSGIVILESTAHGFEWFKDKWDQSVRLRQISPESLIGFTPIFFSWLEHKSYRRKLPPGYVVDNLDEYESDLVDLGADDEQLYWRRLIIEDKCDGDPKIFCQENPATAEQAFLSSGRKRIPLNVITLHENSAKAAGFGRRFRFSWGDGKTLAVEEGKWQNNFWELWEVPDPVCGYTIGGDVSEGLLSDTSNPRSDPDRTTAYILNRRYLRQAGRWQGPSVSETDFGREMLKAATFFNNAWCSPEVNNTGKASVLVLSEAGYEHLYKQLGKAEANRPHSGRPLYGWRTTGGINGTRNQMIADWVDICRPRATQAISKCMVVKSILLVEEEKTFVTRSNGRVEHATGKHDDEIFAAMIAYQLHLECPLHQVDSDERIYIPTDSGMLPGPAYGFVGGLDEKAQQHAEAIASMRNDDSDIQIKTY